MFLSLLPSVVHWLFAAEIGRRKNRSSPAIGASQGSTSHWPITGKLAARITKP